MLYWSIGRDILDQQRAGGWGGDVVGRIAQDLSADTGSARGFSRRNLFYMRRFAAMWPDSGKVQTLSAQIGWSHHQVLLDAFREDPDLYAWYAAKTVANRWSVRQLQTQIHLRLHERQGAGVSNFAEVVGSSDAQTLLEATKDPYVFDFLELAEDARERQLEQALIDDIQSFLIELGSGFVAGATVEIGQGSGAGPTAIPASKVVVVSPTEITATTGGLAKPGTFNLFVIDSGATSAANTGDDFTYTP